MFKGLQVVSGDLLRYGAFRFVTRFVQPELLMVALYLATWIDPYVFGEKTFNGLMWGLWLEFVFAHAQTASGVVGLAFGSNLTRRRIAVGLISLFYLLFVGAISVAVGSVLTSILFIVLSLKRIIGDHHETELFNEIFYAFFKVMIFLLTAAVGAGLAAMVPAAVDNVPEGVKGAEMVPAWGVCYFTALFFYERFAVKKFFTKRTEKKGKKNRKNVSEVSRGALPGNF